MTLAGNPKIFGPAFCGLMVVLTFGGSITAIVHSPSPIQYEYKLLAIGLLSLTCLNLGAIFYYNIFKPVLVVPVIAFAFSLLTSVYQSLESNVTFLALLFVFSAVGSAITILSKHLVVKKISALGLYDVKFKKQISEPRDS